MTGRVRFANQLRGLAALSVAASHLIGVYWAMPDVVSAVTFSPPQQGPIPAAYALVDHTWFNAGPFGVAIFFLISGMVVPFSLDKHSRLTFIGARLLRIYPTYIAALLLEMAASYLTAATWHRPFTIPPSLILSNALLVYDLVGHPSLDLVNWTLSVELKFYLLVVLLASPIRRGSALTLLAAALAILALNALIAQGYLGDIAALPSSPTYTASSHSLCLIFMLIGTAFNFHLRGLVSTPKTAALLLALTAIFLVTWRLTVWQVQYPLVTANYLYAILLFTFLYVLRRHIPKNPVLDAMAAISFPFYVLHSLLGYILLRALMLGLNLAYAPALAITLPTLIVAATALHYAIERPTARAGQSLARLRPASMRPAKSPGTLPSHPPLPQAPGG